MDVMTQSTIYILIVGLALLLGLGVLAGAAWEASHEPAASFRR